MWTGTNPEPAYGTPGAGGAVAIPPGYDHAGMAGFYAGHVPAGTSANVSDLATTNLDVNPPAPVITTASLPPAPFNAAYSQTLSAGNGTAPYTWSITDGTLPSGLVLDGATGAITGSPTVAGTQDVTFEVTDANQLSATTTLAITIAPPGPYSPLVPLRICDTRAGNPSNLDAAPASQCNGGSDNAGSRIRAGGTETITAAGNFGVPTNATAVVLNVTAVNPAGSGFVSAYPTGAALPTTASVNYSAGQAVPNLVEVGTGTNGEVSFFSSKQADLVVDLEGYVAPVASGGSGAGLYNPLTTPARICDTRSGNISNLNTSPENQCNGVANAGETLGADGTLNVQVAGAGGVPIGATAAILNITAVGPTARGYLSVYPQDSTQPSTANVNYTAGQISGNRVVVPLSSTGPTPGFVTVFTSEPAVVVDVSGYYSAAAGSGTQFSAESAPVRICDTRPGNPSNLTGEYNQCTDQTIGPAGTDTFQVTGLAGIPTGATAVVVNLTAVHPTQGTYLTVFPGPSPALVCDLNPAVGDVKGNLTVGTLSPNGTLSIYNNTGSVNVVVDVLGWYS